MLYSIVLGIVIVALGAGVVAYTFWHEGAEVLPDRRRRNTG